MSGGSCISGIVDIPNACATLAIPTEFFAFDIEPTASGPNKMMGSTVDRAKAS